MLVKNVVIATLNPIQAIVCGMFSFHTLGLLTIVKCHSPTEYCCRPCASLHGHNEPHLLRVTSGKMTHRVTKQTGFTNMTVVVLQWPIRAPNQNPVTHYWTVVERKRRGMTVRLNKSAGIASCDHVNLDQNLKGTFPTESTLRIIKAILRAMWALPSVSHKVDQWGNMTQEENYWRRTISGIWPCSDPPPWITFNGESSANYNSGSIKIAWLRLTRKLEKALNKLFALSYINCNCQQVNQHEAWEWQHHAMGLLPSSLDQDRGNQRYSTPSLYATDTGHFYYSSLLL